MVLNGAWRIAVFTVGLLLLLAGAAMLVLPGPGWATIFVGIALLATEFAWAQRILVLAKRTARKVRDKALDPRTRRRNQTLAAVAGIAFTVVILVYLAFFGAAPPH